MCGIAGWVSARPFTPGEAADAQAVLLHEIAIRGPDGQGAVLEAEGRVGLVHTRLAIIDPEARSDQPYRDAATGSVLVYNGEIYNYLALREELQRTGIVFETAGDTEVILRGYLAQGTDFFRRLRGMYAFALWDARSEELHLLRDPLAIKQLYWTVTPDRVVFGSNPQAAAALGESTLDPAAAVSVAVFGAVLDPLSPYRGIEQLPPATLVTLTLGDDAVRVARHAVEPEIPWTGGTRDDSLQELRAMLQDSVSAHMTADVPVAILQSAGADSTLISTLALAAGHRPELVTLGFEAFRGTDADEVPGARAIADQLGLKHHARYLSREEFDAAQAEFLAQMRTPTGDAFNTFLVTRTCRELGFKVALSGVGGDELFAGYPSFTQLPRLKHAGRLARVPGIKPLARALLEAVWRMEPRRSPKIRHLANHLSDWGRRYLLRRAYMAPEELNTILSPEVVKAGLPRFLGAFDALAAGSRRDTPEGVRALELNIYMRNVLLRDSDWAGMANGVEVRTPLVDIVLLRRLCDAHMHCAYGKPDLGEVTRLAAPALELPPRRRTGFVVPHDAWSANTVDADPLNFGSAGPRAWNRRVLRHWFGDWVVG